jgi:hypothetical protein
MSSKPTRAELVERNRQIMLRQQLELSKVKLSRTKRRIVVCGLYLGLIATTLWLGALTANWLSGNKATAILYFLGAVQIAFYVVLTFSVGDMNNVLLKLDERERAQRDRATALAYRILMVFIAVASSIAIVASTTLHWPVAPKPDFGLSAYLVPLIWFVASLPMAVLAWTLPDPDPDPEPGLHPAADA